MLEACAPHADASKKGKKKKKKGKGNNGKKADDSVEIAAVTESSNGGDESAPATVSNGVDAINAAAVAANVDHQVEEAVEEEETGM